MKNTTLPLRTSLVTLLDGNISYQSKQIRVFEEYLMETETKKKTILNGGVEAYVILLNQTSNDGRLNKFNYNNIDSIQIQVNTVYPAGKGGSKVAEEISQVILDLLFTVANSKASITLPNSFSLFKAELINQRNLNYDLTSSRVWVNQSVLECWIIQ